jgi:hypothetical protein
MSKYILANFRLFSLAAEAMQNVNTFESVSLLISFNDISREVRFRRHFTPSKQTLIAHFVAAKPKHSNAISEPN